jgi:hypothetical protein
VGELLSTTLVPDSEPNGTTSARNLVLGASTPWKRMRRRRGRGTEPMEMQQAREHDTLH